ncbi:hypothetical protein AG1IA_09596 [Rhizoctonia solani AG-1 IA]|uniref:Uncharacterized protein n=1 Tax=Thanatephorus cucumeris (strain AG1-IA) TaxID=983506 RepID=L8WDX9_THACA|nr:hypothetical protein AG1IA_09596 [Rhizoctonia solani AG-1 IA]
MYDRKHISGYMPRARDDRFLHIMPAHLEGPIPDMAHIYLMFNGLGMLSD